MLVHNLYGEKNDATRNSILNLGYAYFNHDELFKLSTSEIVEKLQGNWNNMVQFTRTYSKRNLCKKFKINQRFTPDELINFLRNMRQN